MTQMLPSTVSFVQQSPSTAIPTRNSKRRPIRVFTDLMCYDLKERERESEREVLALVNDKNKTNKQKESGARSGEINLD